MSWQDGENSGQHGREFDALCLRLAQDQLTECGLRMSEISSTTGRGLETNKGLTEGQKIPASALYFTSEGHLDEFLARPSHDKYRDRVVLLPLTSGNAWAVLIGAAQYANCYIGSKKIPNVKLKFTSSAGFNEGALSIVVTTRNASGIAKGSTLLLDYGNKFILEEALPTPDKFEGALDRLMWAQKQALPEEWEKHTAQQDVAMKTELEEAARKRAREEEEAAANDSEKRRKMEMVELGKCYGVYMFN
jgi:hypothetical protein